MSKVTVTYKAPKGDDRVVDMGGFAFFDGQALEIEQDENPALIGKLRTNHHFDVVGGVDEAEASETNEDDTVGPVAKHRGRGVWSIVDGDVTVLEGLGRDEATEFNALGAEDKAIFIEARKSSDD